MPSLFIAEANRLKNAQLYLEKNDNFYKLIEKYEVESGLSELLIKLQNNRKYENDDIMKDLKKITHDLREQKQSLKEQDLKLLDLKQFKKKMVTLQDDIQSLKHKLKSNLNTLQEEEKNYSEQLDIYNQKLHDWERPIKYFSSINYKLHSNLSIENSNTQISEFMNFVNESKGHENGWDVKDHQLFLKFCSKNKNSDQHFDKLQKILPHISLEDIKHHEMWYQKYITLKNKKKEALDHWRVHRNTEILKETININNRATVSNKQAAKNKPAPKSDEAKLKLTQWKLEKEAYRQQILEQEKLQKERLKQFNKEKHALHESIKKSVDQWKETKKSQENIEKLQHEIKQYHEKKIRSIQANKMIKKFQTQDDFYITKMRSYKLTQMNAEVKRSQSSHNVDRNPERLLQPTKQWTLRTKTDKFLEYSTPHVPNINTIQKLRVPEWRLHKNHLGKK